MKGLLNKLNQTPHYSEVIAICSLSDLIISPDTGPVHIAGALKKKCIALFGNIKPDTRVRYYRTVKALYPEGELGCIPCHDVFGSCDLGADRDLSENPGTDCMRLLTPKRIVEAVKEL
jgi:ADP-heptose:LPS heptosyltransferase